MKANTFVSAKLFLDEDNFFDLEYFDSFSVKETVTTKTLRVKFKTLPEAFVPILMKCIKYIFTTRQISDLELVERVTYDKIEFVQIKNRRAIYKIIGGKNETNRIY